MKKFLLPMVLCFAGSVASASTVSIIDFETGFSDGDDITGVDLGGVTLTRGGDSIVVTSSVPGGGSSFAIQSVPFTVFNPFRADFSTPVSSFSVDLGDFGPSDDDDLTVEAYAADNSLVGLVNFNYGTAGNALVTLGVTAPEISYVLFNGGSTDFPGSVYADNLTFTAPMAVIPLPASGLLLLSGLGIFAIARRRRTK